MKRAITLLLAAVMLLGTVFSAAFAVSADPELKVSKECVEILKKYEGFSKYPYWDYGQWTVGYGTRCPANKLEEYKANGITEEEAEALLYTYIAGYEEDLYYFINKYNLNTKQHQFDAMFLFSYNCGSGWMYSSNNNFHKCMANPNASPEEILYQFGTWSNAGNTPLTGLIKRRLAEANMYINGVYSSSRPSNFCYVKYDTNGGEVEDCVHAYDVEGAPQQLKIPTYAGYTFEGWYTEKTGGVEVTVLDASKDTMTLYAHWSTGESGNNGNSGDETETPVDGAVDLDPAVTVTVTTDELLIRKGPGTNYTKVGYVVEGTQLVISKIATDNVGRTWGCFEKGWVCLTYTDYDKVTSDTPAEPEAPAEPETPAEPEAPTEPETPAEPEETEGVAGTITANGWLNIRSGPGTGYELVGKYLTGERVVILEQKVVGVHIWGRTDLGWISMAYVKLDEDVQETPEETPAEPEQTPEETPEEPEQTPEEPEQDEEPATDPNVIPGTVKVNGTLCIRSGPGISYKIVGYYKNGDKVAISEQSGNWGKTEKGWISMTYVVLNPTSGTTGGSDDTGSSDTTVPSDAMTGTIKVSGSLNIRNGPGTGYSIAGYYTNGTRITILETKGSWARTDKGWVSMSYVVLDNPTNSAKETRTITASCLNVRASASPTSTVVGYYYRGETVVILEFKGDWGRTSKGWISLQYTK